MSSEIAALVSHADTLQEVVEHMLRMHGRDDTAAIRRFLTTLRGDDYRFLTRLDFAGKLIYLEWRYALSSNFAEASTGSGAASEIP